MSILVRVCIWVLGLYKLEAHGHLSGLCVSYYTLVFVCSMQLLSYMLWMRNSSMTFLLELDFICNKALLYQELYFVYVMEAFIIFN